MCANRSGWCETAAARNQCRGITPPLQASRIIAPPVQRSQSDAPPCGKHHRVFIAMFIPAGSSVPRPAPRASSVTTSIRHHHTHSARRAPRPPSHGSSPHPRGLDCRTHLMSFTHRGRTSPSPKPARIHARGRTLPIRCCTPIAGRAPHRATWRNFPAFEPWRPRIDCRQRIGRSISSHFRRRFRRKCDEVGGFGPVFFNFATFWRSPPPACRTNLHRKLSGAPKPRKTTERNGVQAADSTRRRCGRGGRGG